MTSPSKFHTQYGFFCGGDPRHFTPDEESCSPEEIAAWNEACAMWDRADREKLTLKAEEGSCRSVYNDKGELSLHITMARYGIGVSRYPCEGESCGLCEIGDEPQ